MNLSVFYICIHWERERVKWVYSILLEARNPLYLYSFN